VDTASFDGGGSSRQAVETARKLRPARLLAAWNSIRSAGRPSAIETSPHRQEPDMFANRKTLPLCFGAVMFFAPLAAADGFGITFGATGKHAGFGIEFTTRAIAAPAPPPPAIQCAPEVWVPGHYEVVLQPVWVEGPAREVWCAPAYQWRRDSCGRLFKIMVSPGHWTTVTSPGHNETRRVEVWQPGRWQIAAVHPL
jgi:hypothetical protein